MANFQNISKELREIAPVVANLGNNNPYTVPMGYFDGLADDILQRVDPANNISKLKQQPYAVPSGYFDDLAGSILNKINSGIHRKKSETDLELEQIAPLLGSIGKANIFSVPDGYFEAFQVSTPFENKQAKVIAMGSSIRKWVTYAAAASVLFVCSTASYLYVNQHVKSIDKSLTIEQRLANLEDEEIVNYLKNDLGEFDPDRATSIEQDPDINHLLINASDAEIERYLDAESSDSSEEIIKGI